MTTVATSRPRRAATGVSARTLRFSAVAALAGAEVIHVATIPIHVVEWVLAARFFVVLAAIEGLLAVGLLLRPSRLVIRITITVSLATVVLWVVSRSSGLPFGPGALRAGPIGRPDLIATLLETVTAGALLATPTVEPSDPSAPTPGWTDLRLVSCVVVGVAVLTWAAVLT